MKNLKINIREVVVSKEAEDNAFCDVFVYEPENVAEQFLGSLCIVGEVSNLTDNSSYLINLLASVLKKEFYSNTKRTSLESLEASLHKANVTLTEFTEQGNTGWIGNLHMACMVFKGNELHFSKAGKIKTFLVRDFQATDIGQDLLEGEKPDPFKTFANIASGTLEVGDILILGTPKVFEVFSLERMKEEITKLDLDEFASLIQESIADSEEIDIAGLLAVKVSEKDKRETLPHYKIDVLPKQEEGVEENQNIILSSHKQKEDLKILPENQNIISDDNNLTEGQAERGTEKPFYNKIKIFPKTIFGKRKLADLVWTAATRLFHIFGKIISKIIYFLKTETLPVLTKLGKKAFNKIEKIAKRVVVKGKDSAIGFARQIVDSESRTNLNHRLKRKLSSKKIILVVMFVLIIFFAADIVWIKHQKNKKAEFEYYNELLLSASQKESESEQAIIYQDFNKARELLKEADSLSSQVIPFRDLENQARELRQKIKSHSDKVDHINRLGDPELVLDFARVAPGAEADGLVKTGSEIYSFSSENNGIYRLNLTEKSVSRILADSDSLGHFKTATFLSGTKEIIFVTDTPSLAIFNLDKSSLKKAETSFTSDNSGIKDISSFGANIYLLDTENNQIYKRARSLGGFRAGKEWIIAGQKANLKDAVSLAIDGDIFVLKSNGEIEKYSRGVKKDFSASSLIEPLDNPTKIYTEIDFDYLYVLDPRHKKIVQYDKATGELVNQYTSEKFDDLKDIIIDSQENRMYLLNGKKIFEVEILK